jgi:hypothetical protein
MGAPVLMKSTVKIVFIIVVSMALIAVVYLSLYYWKNRPRSINCDDGERQTIDYRDFQINYSGNKISLEIEVMDKLKLRPEIDPQVLQMAYESTQNWDQFLKGLVVGYNSCAISKADYAVILQRYKIVEETSKNLSQLLRKSPLTQQDMETAKRLIQQYSSTSQELFTQSVVR